MEAVQAHLHTIYGVSNRSTTPYRYLHTPLRSPPRHMGQMVSPLFDDTTSLMAHHESRPSLHELLRAAQHELAYYKLRFRAMVNLVKNATHTLGLTYQRLKEDVTRHSKVTSAVFKDAHEVLLKQCSELQVRSQKQADLISAMSRENRELKKAVEALQHGKDDEVARMKQHEAELKNLCKHLLEVNEAPKKTERNSVDGGSWGAEGSPVVSSAMQSGPNPLRSACSGTQFDRSRGRVAKGVQVDIPSEIPPAVLWNLVKKRLIEVKRQ